MGVWHMGGVTAAYAEPFGDVPSRTMGRRAAARADEPLKPADRHESAMIWISGAHLIFGDVPAKAGPILRDANDANGVSCLPIYYARCLWVP